MTYLPEEKLLRWAYAGHPPALSMLDGREFVAPSQGFPLGIGADPDRRGIAWSRRPGGVLLYTDGLTEARREASCSGSRA